MGLLKLMTMTSLAFALNGLCRNFMRFGIGLKKYENSLKSKAIKTKKSELPEACPLFGALLKSYPRIFLVIFAMLKVSQGGLLGTYKLINFVFEYSIGVREVSIG